MITICPTVTAENADEYNRQMQRIEPFAHRIHVDVADGDFAPRKLVGLDNVWWRGNRTIDLHVMYRRPSEHSEIIMAMAPRLVIVHAESDGNFYNFANHLRKHGMEVGIALLQATPVDTIVPAMKFIDHVLIFSGNLGYQGGGEVDFNLLEKAKWIRKLKPTIEIGWDGGVTADNITRIAEGGVDVINAGSFIQHSHDPAAAYATLVRAVT